MNSFYSNRLQLHFNHVNENCTIKATRNNIGLIHFNIVPKFTLWIYFHQFSTEQCTEIHIRIRCVPVVPSDSFVSRAKAEKCYNVIGSFKAIAKRTSVQYLWWYMEFIERSRQFGNIDCNKYTCHLVCWYQWYFQH